jgi:hypothetical protein
VQARKNPPLGVSGLVTMEFVLTDILAFIISNLFYYCFIYRRLGHDRGEPLYSVSKWYKSRKAERAFRIYSDLRPPLGCFINPHPFKPPNAEKVKM